VALTFDEVTRTWDALGAAIQDRKKKKPPGDDTIEGLEQL